MTNEDKIVPILIGTDMNMYGMARSFHEEYGIKSHCVGVAELSMTKNSEICDVTVVDHLKDDQVFVKTIKALVAKHTAHDNQVKPVIMAAGDEYTELLIRNRPELEDCCWIPYPSEQVLNDVYYKDHFYQRCEEAGLPYPETVVVTADNFETEVAALKLKFPVAMKPADAAQQIALDFEGQRKAYKFDNKEQIIEMIKRTYAAGYRGKILLQDFIPGGDTQMYTVNFYADAQHNARLMTMGRQLLQDPSPFLVGNYVATFIEYHEEIEAKLEHFIKEIGYTGFGNFDLKFDQRDQQFKLIELNPRQGRSAFYSTASGYNLVKPMVEDLVFKEPFKATVYAKTDFLWLGVPAADAVANVTDPEIKAHMQHLIDAGRYGNTLSYPADKSIRRNHRIKKYYSSYTARFAEKATSKVSR